MSSIKKIADRVERAKVLDGLVPTITGYRNNFYRYNYVEGKPFSDRVNLTEFGRLLSWAKMNLWGADKVDESYKALCQKFYMGKTLERLINFTIKTNRQDKTEMINGVEVPSVKSMLGLIPKELIETDHFSMFHGDFILENIIYNNGSFTLIDYRQDFAGSLDYGDMHYDLAKLNHNLTVDHSILEAGLYTIEIKSHDIKVDIHIKSMLADCQKLLQAFCEQNYNWNKVQILTPIIWINMAPLHPHPIDKFLYYFGRYQLWKCMKHLSYL
jgi:hypothetical protein